MSWAPLKKIGGAFWHKLKEGKTLFDSFFCSVTTSTEETGEKGKKGEKYVATTFLMPTSILYFQCYCHYYDSNVITMSLLHLPIMFYYAETIQ